MCTTYRCTSKSSFLKCTWSLKSSYDTINATNYTMQYEVVRKTDKTVEENVQNEKKITRKKE